ncbi:TadE/TadG family type IV pilus assembly protein [Micromonospora parathelypteridis]|uniref:Flp pilus assembly protein TadG n=1 Tax=Micromonospora parathelypteridis TaxID=1839617 RepID=A0A840W2M3_9ACTN|nr:TadE/TadG family type IV pilus assembly protein [Micromonospora parathelypteridis]MBB5478519.1 Flp pilus assembly protein TadG [Micromonospora parathelypteridis]GGO05833.1 membrane protein [Micromonospora parathelypteridis]
MTRTTERGSVSIEVAVLAPAFIALMVLAGVVGRTAVAAEAVETAAHDAARAASISRNSGTARQEALEAAQKQLDWHGLACTNDLEPGLTGTVAGVDTTFDSAFSSKVGEDATVTVTITCLVSFRDIALDILPGMQSERQITAEFTSPLDRYRGRQ